MSSDLVERLRAISAAMGSFGSIEREAANRIEALEAENEALREIVSRCAEALGNGAAISTIASVEFMAMLPGEIALYTARLRDSIGLSRTIFVLDETIGKAE